MPRNSIFRATAFCMFLAAASTLSTGLQLQNSTSPVSNEDPDGGGSSSNRLRMVAAFNDGHWVPTHSRVRYEWELHSGHMAAFDIQAFCDSLPGNLLIVGDSVSGGHYEELVLELSKGKRKGHHYPSWYTGDDPWKPFPVLHVAEYPACNGMRTVAYIRNDYLTLNGSTSHLPPAQAAESLREGQRRRSGGGAEEDFEVSELDEEQGAPDGISLPWAFPEVLRRFQVVVFNTGAHERSDEDFLGGLRQVLQLVAQHDHLRGSARVFFRSTVPGFDGCDEFRRAEPFTDLAKAEKFYAEHPWHGGPTFKHQNQLAHKLFLEAGHSVLDAYTPTVLRVDSHKGLQNKDCLHWDLPGPYPHWNRLLQNSLAWVDSKK